MLPKRRSLSDKEYQLPDKMIRVLLLPFILTSIISSAQLKNFNTEQEIWLKGEANNGEGLFEGELNYNFVSDILRIRNSNGDIKSIVAENMDWFTLTENNHQKSFISLPLNIDGLDRIIQYFFELLYIKGKYRILSKHHARVRLTNGDFGIASRVEEVIEVIYLVDMEKQILVPVMQKRKSKSAAVHTVFGKLINKNAKRSESATDSEVRKFKEINKKGLDAIVTGSGKKGYRNGYGFKFFFQKDFKAFKSHNKEHKLDPFKLEDLKKALEYKS